MDHQVKRRFCSVTSSAVINPESASLASSDCARVASSRNSAAISATGSASCRWAGFGFSRLRTRER